MRPAHSTLRSLNHRFREQERAHTGSMSIGLPRLLGSQSLHATLINPAEQLHHFLLTHAHRYKPPRPPHPRTARTPNPDPCGPAPPEVDRRATPAELCQPRRLHHPFCRIRLNNLVVLIVPNLCAKNHNEGIPVEPLEPSPMSTSHPLLLCRYHFDALDRLVSQTPANEAEHQRFYCQSRLATAIQGTFHHSIIQHGALLLAQQNKSSHTLDITLLAMDPQRSILQTLKANNQRDAIAYSPYGHHPPSNGLTSLLGFNGEQPDPVTRHYLLGKGYRAFNPVLMRFNTPDYLSPFAEGGLNCYGYCWGDPVNLNDPTGKSPLSKLTAGVRIHYIQRKLRLEQHKLSNFKLVLKNKADTLAAQPKIYVYDDVPTLLTLVSNTLSEKQMSSIRAKFGNRLRIHQDKPKPPMSQRKLARELSRLESFAIRNSNGEITGFVRSEEVAVAIGNLPKSQKLLQKITRVSEEYFRDEQGGDIIRLPFHDEDDFVPSPYQVRRGSNSGL